MFDSSFVITDRPWVIALTFLQGLQPDQGRSLDCHGPFRDPHSEVPPVAPHGRSTIANVVACSVPLLALHVHPCPLSKGALSFAVWSQSNRPSFSHPRHGWSCPGIDGDANPQGASTWRNEADNRLVCRMAASAHSATFSQRILGGWPSVGGQA